MKGTSQHSSNKKLNHFINRFWFCLASSLPKLRKVCEEEMVTKHMNFLYSECKEMVATEKSTDLRNLYRVFLILYGVLLRCCGGMGTATHPQPPTEPLAPCPPLRNVYRHAVALVGFEIQLKIDKQTEYNHTKQRAGEHPCVWSVLMSLVYTYFAVNALIGGVGPT